MNISAVSYLRCVLAFIDEHTDEHTDSKYILIDECRLSVCSTIFESIYMYIYMQLRHNPIK